MQLRLASFFFLLGGSIRGCIQCQKSPSKASVARHTSITNHATKLNLPRGFGRICSSATQNYRKQKKIIVSRGGVFEDIIDKNTQKRRGWSEDCPERGEWCWKSSRQRKTTRGGGLGKQSSDKRIVSFSVFSNMSICQKLSETFLLWNGIGSNQTSLRGSILLTVTRRHGKLLQIRGLGTR